MAQINIPGNPNQTTRLNDGEPLTIHWANPCKFCIVSGSPDDFNPPLPAGQAAAQGHNWNGTACVPSGTVTYSWPGSNEPCEGNPRNVGGSGTIIIGDGRPRPKSK